jgi:hypothetical protein
MPDGKHENDLDQALEDSFPASDPISMTQREHRQGAPKQNGRSAAQAVKDTARKIEHDYLWLGGAFILGCLVGIAARSAPSAFARKGYGEQLLDRGGKLQRKLSGKVSDLHLQRKLSELLDRLH